MQTNKSINLTKKVDPRRKQLIKQLQKSIADQNVQKGKRNLSLNLDEVDFQQTMKKKRHMDINVLRDKKQNDRNMIVNRQKQPIVKSNSIQNPQLSTNQQKKPGNSIILEKQQPQNPKSIIAQQNQPILMLNPGSFGFGQHFYEQYRNFSEKERLLISIQQKLDNYLMFVKENRKKKKGQLFAVIKRNFLQNYKIFLEFSHIKKIMYIDENLYSVHKLGDGVEGDCLIDLKFETDDNDKAASIYTEIKQRKVSFKNKLAEFKERYQTSENQQNFQIPEVKFKFEELIQESKNNLKKSLKQLFDAQHQNKKKIDRFFVLENKNSSIYKESKKILLNGIKRVEKIVKKENQILEMAIFTNKMFEKKQLTKKELEAYIEQISMIYRTKNVTNILFTTLLDLITKKIILTPQISRKVLEYFVTLASQCNKSKPMLKQIHHRSGMILQFDRNSVKQFKNALLSNEQWIKMFQFEMEMSDQYVRKRLQEQRQKVHKEISKNADGQQDFDDRLFQEPEPQQNIIKIKRPKVQVDDQAEIKLQTLNEERYYVQKELNCTPSQEQIIIDDLDVKLCEQESKKQEIQILNPLKFSKGENMLKPIKEEFRSTISNSENIFEEQESNT